MKIEATSIDNQNAAELLAAGVQAICAGDAQFDLSAVRAVDSAAVSLLLAWTRAARAAGLPIRFLSLPPGTVSLARLYGVDELLAIDADSPTAAT